MFHLLANSAITDTGRKNLETTTRLTHTLLYLPNDQLAPSQWGVISPIIGQKLPSSLSAFSNGTLDFVRLILTLTTLYHRFGNRYNNGKYIAKCSNFAEQFE
jgi:hypothetical protein